MKQICRLMVQLILISLVVGVIYSPNFKAEPCLLDDVTMLKGLQGDVRLDLKSLIIPNSAYSTYYRPLIGVSYWCDQTFWNANTQAMHIENVIFHLLNVVLLFWLIRLLLPNDVKSNSTVPFFGALLFAVHPITTESVCWISGRTDLIAAACLTSATIALVLWQKKLKHWWLLILTLLLLAGAILTKEVAWGFLLVMPLFLVSAHDSITYPLGSFLNKLSRIEKLLLLMGIALSFFLTVVLLSYWPVVILSVILALLILDRKPRSHPLSGKIRILVPALLLVIGALLPFGIKLIEKNTSYGFYSKFSRTILQISLDVDNSIGLFSAAIAFYIKKFFLPLPLSFSIINIAPEYMFVGIAVIIMLAFLAAWRSQAAILFLAGIALLLPALPLVHGQIAWTPYAERYIYISSIFWIASLSLVFGSLRHPCLRNIYTALCLVLIPAAALTTWKRSEVWQTNVSLFRDTVQKSPNHLEARVMYMVALSKAGRLPEALDQFRLIKADAKSWMRIRYYNDLAELCLKNGLEKEALEILDTSMAMSLPLGKKHPLPGNEWQRLYKFRKQLHRE